MMAHDAVMASLMSRLPMSGLVLSGHDGIKLVDLVSTQEAIQVFCGRANGRFWKLYPLTLPARIALLNRAVKTAATKVGASTMETPRN
jgi:hypothetical protein